MKKNPHEKFKAVQELYIYSNNTLLNSKAVGSSNISLKESTVDQASVDVSSQELFIENHRELHSGEASIHLSSHENSSSEAFESFDSLKASDSLEDQPMLQNFCTQSTLEHQVHDVLDCRGNDISCVSKEDGKVMISGDHSGGADHKNVTSGSNSVSNPCPDILGKSLMGKSLIGESVTNGSLVDHMLVEESDHNSRAQSSGSVLPAKGFCDGLNFNSPITSIQEPHLQNQNVLEGDGSEELVDVRVCDTCGDAGREALLALCSNCSDGAQHTYCMTIRMDKVPENDWLCEECVWIREPKRHQQTVVERSDDASKPSYSKKLSEGSPSTYTAVKHVGKTHLSNSSGVSGKRLSPSKDVSFKPKKRTVDQRDQLPKISRPVRHTRLAQVSSVKNMEKNENPAHQLFSSVDLPAKKVEQAGSSRCRSSKPGRRGGNNLEVQCSRKDIGQSSSKENAACELKKMHPDKEVFKSLSCTVVGPIPLDVPNAHSSAPTIEAVECGNDKQSAEKVSQENKTSQLRQTRVVSETVKSANVSRKNVEDNNALQINGDIIVEPLDSLANEGTGSVEEPNLPGHSSYVAISPAAKGDAGSDQRVSLSTQQAKIDLNDQPLDVDKIQPFDLEVMPTVDPADIDHTVPSAISAIPDSRFIWKGSFKLDKNGKLSSDCHGLQAHLSTHASPKVDELVLKFSTELQFKEVPRVNTWPIQFQKNHPTEQDIALYFFAQDSLSYQTSYRNLLEGMTSNDLALEANFGDFQLLVFPSNLLPEKLQRWNAFLYLWGVFRARKLDDSCLPNLNISPMNQLFGSIVCGSERKFVSPLVSGSVFASDTSKKSLNGEEFVDPVVLQSLASMKFRGHSGEREVPSLEEYALKEHQLQAGNTIFRDDLRTKGFDSGLQNGWIFTDEDVMIVSNTDEFRCGKSTTPVGFCSDGASGSSVSLDSGPSGLTDSGWCAKSADEVLFENPRCNDIDLNLDLCLGPGPELDLTIGFPSRSANQPEDYSKNASTSNQDDHAPIGLSLGKPSSVW